jgi:hypothetical protein
MLRGILLLLTVGAIALLLAAPALADAPFLEGANLNLPEAPCEPGKAEPSDPTPSNDPQRGTSAPGDLPKIDNPDSGGFSTTMAGCSTPLPSEVMNHNIL